jgi:hypothetical protein
VIVFSFYLFFSNSTQGQQQQAGEGILPGGGPAGEELRAEKSFLLAHQEAPVSVHAPQANADPQEDPDTQANPQQIGFLDSQENGRHGNERIPRRHFF